MVDEIFSPNTFDEYLNNATGVSSSQSYGAKFVPVKRWERDEFGSYCSCCGSYAYRDRFGQPIESKFCPNCGADLGGVTTDAKKRYIEVGKIPWRCAPNISPAEPFVTITDIKKMQDADVVEQDKGKWIRNSNGTYSCNLCQSWIPNEQRHYANFCLFCGADMREEER